MKPFASFSTQSTFAAAVSIALPVGAATSLLVFSIGISGSPVITSIADFLGGVGNDLFLISTNLLIIAWAWRQRLRSIISLTLWLDFLVWVTVQGTKLLVKAPWTLRPNGQAGGFPSGHATHGFAMAFLLTFLFPRLGWLWYLCAAAISWSRLETYAHSDFQIVVGIILGTAIGWILAARWLSHPEAVGFTPSVDTPVSSVSSPKQAYAANKVS